MKIEYRSDYASAAFVHDNLYAFNCRRTGAPVDPAVRLACDVAWHTLLITDDDGGPCGGAVFRYREAEADCYLALLWVADALRSQGWGQRLLDALREHALAADVHVIRLLTLEFQAPAFYARVGFALEKQDDCGNCPAYHYRLTI